MQTEVFKALSDENRLHIVEMLKGGEISACAILQNLDITQPTLSHHMKVLQSAGLVNSRRSGQWSIYSLNLNKFEEIVDFVQCLKTMD